MKELSQVKKHQEALEVQLTEAKHREKRKAITPSTEGEEEAKANQPSSKQSKEDEASPLASPHQKQVPVNISTQDADDAPLHLLTLVLHNPKK